MKGIHGRSYIIKTDEVLNVVRESPTIWVDGVPESASKKTFQIKCNVQPVEGRDLLLVPEGDRFKENYWVFTYDEIVDNDVIHREGKKYQLQNVQNWGNFRECRMTRQDVGYRDTP